MSQSKDASDKFNVDRSDLLMRLYKMYDTKEESTTLLISALAQHVCTHKELYGDSDVEETCEKVRKELKNRLSTFLENRQ